jgi:fructose/tagatose bisphosphate aldolase
VVDDELFSRKAVVTFRAADGELARTVEDEVLAARAAGVNKFNADTDLRHAFRAGLEAVFATGDRQLEEAMAEGRKRMVAATIEKMKLYGCAGKARELA